MALTSVTIATSDVVAGQKLYSANYLALIAQLQGFIDDVLDKVILDEDNQAIAGIKTFSSFPVGPSSAPTTDYQFGNKKYVDDQITAIQDPAYTGGESHTFGGGLIIKSGKAVSSKPTVTFGAAFTNNVVSITATAYGATSLNLQGAIIKSESKTGFIIDNNEGTTTGFYWMAIGY